MKKIYQIPAIKWLEAETEDMVAASPLDISGDSGSTKVIDEDATGPGLSRENSLWDSEE